MNEGATEEGNKRSILFKRNLVHMRGMFKKTFIELILMMNFAICGVFDSCKDSFVPGEIKFFFYDFHIEGPTAISMFLILMS